MLEFYGAVSGQANQDHPSEKHTVIHVRQSAGGMVTDWRNHIQSVVHIRPFLPKTLSSARRSHSIELWALSTESVILSAM